MKTINLSSQQLDFMRSLIQQDITELAINRSFFFEMKLEPKDYIDQMTAVARMFELDFWEVLKMNCTENQLERLQVLYEGRAEA